VLERFVRMHPAQWVWMHDRWRRGLGEGETPTWEDVFDAP
jgi:lauroyl/myristoyl acyltransferase